MADLPTAASCDGSSVVLGPTSPTLPLSASLRPAVVAACALKLYAPPEARGAHLIISAAIDSQSALRFDAVVVEVYAPLPELAVDPTGRFLVERASGTRFFWLADTLWHGVELAPAEVAAYLDVRASQAFNVIQGPVAIHARAKPHSLTDPMTSADLPDALRPNYAGLRVFRNVEKLEWSEPYLQHLDHFVGAAGARGLRVAIPVIWGPLVDLLFDEARAFAVGRALGERYRSLNHVIWLVAGEFHKIRDYEPYRWNDPLSNRQQALLNALASGLEQGHAGRHLMSIHPDGGRSSSDTFGNAAWLDFHMIQTFELSKVAGALVATDLNRKPPVPTLNAEPRYEGSDRHTRNAAFETRYQAYQAVFDGAFGHTYGHHDIWPVNAEGRTFRQDSNAVPWTADLHSEGALDMQHLRTLIEWLLPHGGIPDRMRWIANEASPYGSFQKLAAIADPKARTLLVYAPDSSVPVEVYVRRLAGSRVRARWFDPRNGEMQNAKATAIPSAVAVGSAGAEAVQVFEPPGAAPDRDWVLVLKAFD